MASDPQATAVPEMFSMYLRLDSGDARVIARGVFCRIGNNWDVELRCPSGAEPYRAIHPPENAGIILWLMALLDREHATPAR